MIWKSIFDFSQDWKVFFLIAFAAFCAYSASLSSDFIWDDSMNISSNTFVHDWKNFPLIFTRQYLTSPDQLHLIGREMVGAGEASYRPVVTITYFLDYFFWKLNPFGYHLTSLILHILCGWLVYIFLGAFIRHRGAILAVALIFVVHPVQTEAVIVPSMREDLLATFFYLITLILYVRLFHQRNKYEHKGFIYALMLVTYGLGLFSKEMAITLPVMLFLIDIFLRREMFGWRMFFRRRYWGFYAVSAVYFLIWKFVMGRPEGFVAAYPGGSFYTNILNMIKVMGTYGQWILFPWTVKPTLPTGIDFVVTHFWSPHVAESLLGILCVIGGSILLSRKMPLIALAALWFVVALGPVMNIIPLQNIYAARFLYLPMVGVMMGMALIFESFFEQKFFFKFSKNFFVACLGVLIVFCTAMTYAQHFRWKNELLFRLALVKDYPLHMSARVGLAHAYRNQLKNPSLATDQFLIAKTIDPEYLQNFIDLSEEYRKAGDDADAIKILEEAVERNPRNMEMRDILCAFQGNVGRLTEAAQCFEQILKIDPHYYKSYGDLQRCYLLMDRRKDAAVVGILAIAQVKIVEKDRLKK